MIRIYTVCIALSVAACSQPSNNSAAEGDGDIGTVDGSAETAVRPDASTPDGFREAFWWELCHAGFTCPTANTVQFVGRFASEAACQAHRPIPVLSPFISLDFLGDPTRIEFDGSKADACLDSIGSRLCDGLLQFSFGLNASLEDVPVVDRACAELVTGLATEGEVCQGSAQCIPGYYCDGGQVSCGICRKDNCTNYGEQFGFPPCTLDEYCDPPGPPGPGETEVSACHPRKPLGEPCGGNDQCDFGLSCGGGTCSSAAVVNPGQPLAAAGESCNACLPGLACVGRWSDDMQSIAATCVTPLLEGAACLATSDCTVGLKCLNASGAPGEYGTCVPAGALGEPCSAPLDCASSNCLYGSMLYVCGAPGEFVPCSP